MLASCISVKTQLTPPQKMLPFMGRGGSIILVAALVGIAGEPFQYDRTFALSGPA